MAIEFFNLSCLVCCLCLPNLENLMHRSPQSEPFINFLYIYVYIDYAYNLYLYESIFSKLFPQQRTATINRYRVQRKIKGGKCLALFIRSFLLHTGRTQSLHLSECPIWIRTTGLGTKNAGRKRVLEYRLSKSPLAHMCVWVGVRVLTLHPRNHRWRGAERERLREGDKRAKTVGV